MGTVSTNYAQCPQTMPSVYRLNVFIYVYVYAYTSRIRIRVCIAIRIRVYIAYTYMRIHVYAYPYIPTPPSMLIRVFFSWLFSSLDLCSKYIVLLNRFFLIFLWISSPSLMLFLLLSSALVAVVGDEQRQLVRTADTHRGKARVGEGGYPSDPARKRERNVSSAPSAQRRFRLRIPGVVHELYGRAMQALGVVSPVHKNPLGVGRAV